MCAERGSGRGAERSAGNRVQPPGCRTIGAHLLVWPLKRNEFRAPEEAGAFAGRTERRRGWRIGAPGGGTRPTTCGLFREVWLRVAEKRWRATALQDAGALAAVLNL